ncbi:hypothetical protein CKQ90_34335, partial [Klebsiella pneumoniae]
RVNVPMGEKGHGMQRALALSLLQVYAEITCNAQVENFFKTISIMIDDRVNVPMGEKGHGMQRALALSLLQVYAEITCNA